MHNIKLTIAYEGEAYLGWQKTKEGSSIEQTLQDILEQILQHPIQLQAASRTDAGVHAVGQVVNFFTSKEIHSLDRLCMSLNSLLPSDLVVCSAEEMPIQFHPTLDTVFKEYHYWICWGSYQLPQHRKYSWHIHCPLQLEEMRQAAKLLVGRHDFTSFTNAKKNEIYKNAVREVQAIEILEHAERRIQFILKGNHFLYKMVRNLVGTLVDVGKKKIKKEDILTILAAKDRTLAGLTAPAYGLTLFKVHFIT